MLSKSHTGGETAHESVQTLSVSYGISSDYLVAMRDRTSVNSVAIEIVKIIYPNALDVGYFSHVFDRVGEHFNIPILTKFIGNWLYTVYILYFSHSIETNFLCKQRTGSSMALL